MARRVEQVEEPSARVVEDVWVRRTAALGAVLIALMPGVLSYLRDERCNETGLPQERVYVAGDHPSTS